MSDRLPTLPSWVSKRDGRLVPFDADQISRGLFAAGESLGQPDAFLARELTDAVVHFLAAENEDPAVPAAQIAELVVKVVRELGHPNLSQAFAEFAARRALQPCPQPSAAGEEAAAPVPFAGLPPGWLAASPIDLAWETTRACLREYTLRTVFTRDLVAAQDDGLLTIGNLEAPRELAGLVLKVPPGGKELVEAIEQTRKLAGGFVAIDGAEHALVEAGADGAAAFVRELGIGLRSTGLTAVVNLNCAAAPSWAGNLAVGPLFADRPASLDEDSLAKVRLALLEQLTDNPRLRVDWHLADRDFQPDATGLLTRLARRAAEGADLAFVFDRPRRPVPLAEGLDRQHPALLQTVVLHLPRLVAQTDTERFLRKLGSLARLALSVAAQKRDYLRRHNPAGLTRGFLLERARLVVAPVGLEAVVQTLTGGPATEKAGLDLGRRIVQELRAGLEKDGKARLLETSVDSSADFGADSGAAHSSAKPRQQIRAAGTIFAGGTVVVPLHPDQRLTADEVCDLLSFAWQHTDVARVCFRRLEMRQLTTPWAMPDYV